MIIRDHSVIKFIFDNISEAVNFGFEVKTLVNSHLNMDLKAMGFIDGWEDLDIWSDV